MKSNSKSLTMWPGVISDPTEIYREYDRLAQSVSRNALAQLGGVGRRFGIRMIDWAAHPAVSLVGLNAFNGLLPFYSAAPKELLLQSLHYACLVVEKHILGGRIYLRSADAELEQIDKLLPYWSKDFGFNQAGKFGGYEEVPGSIDALRSLYASSPSAAKEISQRFALNLSEGNTLSKDAANFVSEILAGWLKPPTPSAGQEAQTHRDTLLALISDELQKRSGYDQGANLSFFEKGSLPKPCGCTIAAAALYAYGFKINARTAINILTKQKKRLSQRDLDRVGLSIYEGAGHSVGLRQGAYLRIEVTEAMTYLLRPI